VKSTASGAQFCSKRTCLAMRPEIGFFGYAAAGCGWVDNHWSAYDSRPEQSSGSRSVEQSVFVGVTRIARASGVSVPVDCGDHGTFLVCFWA